MNDFLQEKVARIANERAKWIDDTILAALSQWKGKVLKRFPHVWLAWLLNVDVEIVSEELIASFGTEVRIYLNGELIGRKMFSL